MLLLSPGAVQVNAQEMEAQEETERLIMFAGAIISGTSVVACAEND